MVIKTLPIPSATTPINSQLGSRRPLLHSQSVSCPPVHRLPDATALRDMCIITKSDMDRIYENLNRRQRDKDAIRQEMEQKKEMLERSMQITKDWPNTFAGDQERKLQRKKIREREEEEKKQLLDLEEEKLAAERRREYLEKAKQTRYYDTDRVRTFHSSLLLTEVLKEREMQIEMRKHMEQMRQISDNDELKRFQEAQDQFDKTEREKNAKRAKDRADLAQYHLTQINRRKTHYIQEKQRNQQEGDEYRRLADKSLLDFVESMRTRKLKQKQTKEMYDKAMEQKQKIKQIEQKLDEEEEDDIRTYAEVKMRIARLRREKEIALEQQKQNTRDETIGYLGSLLKRAEADNESRIYRAQAEKDAKTYREEQEKYEKQQQMLDSIEKHRLQSLKRRQFDRGMEEREDAELRRRKAQADHLFRLYQKEKEKEREQNVQLLGQIQQRQARDRKERERASKENEIQEIQLDKQMNEIERQQYLEYTGRVMSYLEENGRDIHPMQRTVAEEMKRFDNFNHSYKKTETPRNGQEEKKSSSHDRPSLNDTKKHLGFQWEIPQK
ncbi:unnamed protein product [Adineta ricciae]|uniref:Trichohyalin-plectin-homology domain-containing protein n=1 Tax=Adineta ricciae TaxID=249248 RepID=A0A813RCA9_ADIRI|nr:unnamed protein product [Adineta ricciae]CAF0805035.1 unnamed protein product [Adineta ricciae]